VLDTLAMLIFFCVAKAPEIKIAEDPLYQ